MRIAIPAKTVRLIGLGPLSDIEVET